MGLIFCVSQFAGVVVLQPRWLFYLRSIILLFLSRGTSSGNHIRADENIPQPDDKPQNHKSNLMAKSLSLSKRIENRLQTPKTQSMARTVKVAKPKERNSGLDAKS